jgi:hypothetical protein
MYFITSVIYISYSFMLSSNGLAIKGGKTAMVQAVS